MIKTIFLDIDGVLNHERFYRGYSKYPRRQTRSFEKPYSEIDQESVEILNELIKKTDAKIVISSTWRQGRTVQQLQEFFNDFGFLGEIIGVTDVLNFRAVVRGNEIYKWIKDNEKIITQKYYEYKNYVILDDDSDMLYQQRNNFIHIDAYSGITPTNVFHAEKILNQ